MILLVVIFGSIILSACIPSSEVPEQFRVLNCEQYTDVKDINDILYPCTRCVSIDGFQLVPKPHISERNSSQIVYKCIKKGFVQGPCSLYQTVTSYTESMVFQRHSTQVGTYPSDSPNAGFYRPSECLICDLSLAYYFTITFAGYQSIANINENFSNAMYKTSVITMKMCKLKSQLVDPTGQNYMCNSYLMTRAPDRNVSAQNQIFTFEKDSTICLECYNRYVLFSQYPDAFLDKHMLNPCGSCIYSSRSTQSECLKCKEGLVSMIDQRQCVIIPNCAQLDSTDKCSKCVIGYDITHTCKQCSAGFRKSSNNSALCVKETKNCEAYSATQDKCIKCRLGYALSFNNTVRTKSAEIGTNCLVCAEGYFESLLNPQNCIEKVKNCTEYGQLDQCIACQKKYLLNSEGTCFQEVEGCTQYQNSICAKCKETMILSQVNIGTCIQAIKNCKKISYDVCVQCSEQYQLTDDATCNSCASEYHPSFQTIGLNKANLVCILNISNCLDHRSDTQCLVCHQGFSLNGSNGLCDSCSMGYVSNPANSSCNDSEQQDKVLQCFPQLINCVLYDYFGCIQCSSSFKLENNKCLNCKNQNDRISQLNESICIPKIQHCVESSYVYDICLDCVTGHKLVNSSCDTCADQYRFSMIPEKSTDCVPKIKNCEAYSTDTKCKTCKQGYEQKKKGDGQCNSCKAGYVSVLEGTMQLLFCVKQVLNCQKYNSLGCNKCSDQFLLQYSVCNSCIQNYRISHQNSSDCIPKIQNCQDSQSAYNQNDQCIKCLNGFRIPQNSRQNICISEIVGCEQYSEINGSCLLCSKQQGFRNSSELNICVPLTPYCLQKYDSKDICVQCINGYTQTINPNNPGQCFKIINECCSYNESNKCIQCERNYEPSPEGDYCFRKDQNCLKYLNGACVACCYGYAVSVNNPQKCELLPPAFIENCKQYQPLSSYNLRTSTSQCKECQKGYRLSQDFSQCTVGIPFCTQLHEDHCDKCQEGFVLSQDYMSCNQAAIECPDPPNYYRKFVIIEGKCIETDSMCTISDSEGQCLLCESGYKVNNCGECSRFIGGGLGFSG